MFAIILGLVLSCSASGAAEVLVKLRSGTSTEAIRLDGIKILEKRPFRTDASLLKLRLASETDLKHTIETLKKQPDVEFAEPNLQVRLQQVASSPSSTPSFVPNDPRFGKCWSLSGPGMPGIGIQPLWDQGIRGSKKIIVAIVDTGIDWTHPDLQDNLYTHPGEAGEKDSNGKDDDGNGFIDDVHGWDFTTNSNRTLDDEGHGTHIAGIIGAKGNNGIGIAGINWEVSLLPVKFVDGNGNGSLDSAVEAINYARMMKANIINASWAIGYKSEILEAAIAKAGAEGVLFVAAAGNGNLSNDQEPLYPASYDLPNVISVASTDREDEKSVTSNYGIKSVHVAAPGDDIHSTVPGGGYMTKSGTSMAAPHVTGTAALLLSLEPSLSPVEIRERLIRTSELKRSLKHRIISRGRINAYDAIHDIVPPSPEPPESAWVDLPMLIESEHPYSDAQSKAYTIRVPGAKMVRVHFERIDLAPDQDRIEIERLPGYKSIETIRGTQIDYFSEYVESDALIVRLWPDNAGNAYGFKIDKVQYVPSFR